MIFEDDGSNVIPENLDDDDDHEKFISAFPDSFCTANLRLNVGFFLEGRGVGVVRKGHMVYLMAISNGINAPTKLHVLLCFLQRSMICCNHTKEGQRQRKGESLCAFRKEKRSQLIVVLSF